MGLAFARKRDWERAAATFRQALGLQRPTASLWARLGAALAKLGRRQEATAALGEALLWKPEYPEAYNNLGTTLHALGRTEEAERNYRTAAALKPDYPDPLYNLGSLLQDQDRLEEALDCYGEVLRRRPEHEEAHNNRANTLLLAGRTREALASYESLVALNPEHAEAHWNRALLRLQTGDWERGWQDYEWRFRQKEHTPKHFDQPRWMGEPVEGKTILVHAEQGLGDTIQFARFLAPLERLGCRVVFETQPRLKPLLAGLGGVDVLIARGGPPPEHDCQIDLMSLPGRLGVTLETLSAAVPYLRAGPERVEFWRRRS